MADGPDLTIMLLTHDALRRDFARLWAAMRRPGTDAAVRAYWPVVARHLHHHHTMEDLYVWPVLRDRVDAAGTAVLDDMEAEHATIDPLLAKVTARLADHPLARDALSAELDAFATAVEDHLAHEERDALPLVRIHFTAADQRRLSDGARRAAGLSGARSYFPWMLDEADPQLASALLAGLPPPLRLLARGRWRRRHERVAAPLRV